MPKRTDLLEESYDDPQGRTITARQVIATARRMPLPKDVLPEWAGVGDVTRLFGLSRPRIFRLIALDQIESVHVKDPGKKKGIRLIRLESVRAYIRGFAD